MEVEKFRATSGHVSGVLALILAGTVAAVGLAQLDRGSPDWLVAGAVLFGVVVWVAVLRPALWVDARTLVMRNPFETIYIPLAAVEKLAVRQVLAVRVGDRRHISPVVGRTRRETLMGSRKAPAGEVAYADFVEVRLHKLIHDAASAAGVGLGSAEQRALADGVRRERAKLPIGLVVLAVLAVVITVVS